MYYVYILQSTTKPKMYIGYSADLKSRIARHNDGGVQSTKYYRPWSLLYYEAYSSDALAHSREKALKNKGKGWIELKKRIVPRMVNLDGVPIEE
ncbi:GIY-YIG nuclease family protein [Candidatus Kaiserbacteria bacterium]|nr:GIY-YIG nuclease family protein [Candidatus Kaiserbacteria bacterium]